MKIYIEGGRNKSDSECRAGFRQLLEKAGFTDRMPRLIACGPRDAAYDDFKRATEGKDYPVLLVDSESLVTTAEPWDHVQKRDGWQKPQNADSEQLHFMVQCMETWILADQEAVKQFFQQGLSENSLPAVNDLEKRSKDDVQIALENATRHCGRDRQYKKGKRSFKLVGTLDPEKLKQHLPHFKRFCDFLNDKL